MVIEDVDPKIFKHFLEFLYTGAPPDSLSFVARDLLPLADRFGSLALKDMCENAIIANLTETNAFEALSIAHTHNCASLKEKCITLIR